MGGADQGSLYPLQRLGYELQGTPPDLDAARTDVRHHPRRPSHRPQRLVSCVAPAYLLRAGVQELVAAAATPERLPDAKHREQFAAWKDDRRRLLLGDQPESRSFLPRATVHPARVRAYDRLPRQADAN